MTKRTSKRKETDQPERKRLLKLGAMTLLLLLPGFIMWIVGDYEGWFVRAWSADTAMDDVVTILWGGAFLYYGFVVHVMLGWRRIRPGTQMRHLMIAVPLFGGACWLYTLHFAGVTRKLSELISSIGDIDPKTSNILSTILSWIVSGVTGNLAYDIVKKIFKRHSPVQKSPLQRPAQRARASPREQTPD